jgi:hypothetical protein
VRWPSGAHRYFWGGVAISADVGENPSAMTPDRILAERNVEARRMMLARYGCARFMSDSGLRPIQEDPCGALYRVALSDDEPLTMVQVTNRTPEPDGHFAMYLLRVPPWVQTAREAVAWTFSKSTIAYAPQLET